MENNNFTTPAPEDIDAGLNYFGDERDTARKTGVSRTRMTYLSIPGSGYPQSAMGYRQNGG